MPGRIAGIASFFVDGLPMTTKGSLEYQPTNTKRTPIMAMDGSFAGYGEEGEPPYISVTMLDTGVLSVRDLFNNVNIQVVAQLANGKTVTGHSMTIMDAPAVKNEDATFDTKFVGVDVFESIP